MPRSTRVPSRGRSAEWGSIPSGRRGEGVGDKSPKAADKKKKQAATKKEAAKKK
jgi:hypothetical protein